MFHSLILIIKLRDEFEAACEMLEFIYGKYFLKYPFLRVKKNYVFLEHTLYILSRAIYNVAWFVKLSFSFNVIF